MSHKGLVGINALSAYILFGPAPSFAAEQIKTVTAAGTYVCDTAGPDDKCIINCEVQNPGDPIVDCGNAGECEFNCLANQCLLGGKLYANNSRSLLIKGDSAFKECFKTLGEIYLPHSGNATLQNSQKMYKEAIIYAGPNTQNIIIGCDGTNNDDCKNMEVHAETAQYLEITVGDGSSELDSDGNAGGIYCPQNSNYQGPEIAPCIIDVTAKATDAILAVNLHTLNGVPTDFWIKGTDGQTPFSGTSTVYCTAGNDALADTTTLPLTAGDLSNCWPQGLTLSPSRAPTTTPSSSPSDSPSESPSKHPTTTPIKQPTGSPTVNPTKQPTGSPSVTPTNQPSGSPTRNPTNQPTVTGGPTGTPTKLPSSNPTTRSPTLDGVVPTLRPTPQTGQVTDSPTLAPSVDEDDQGQNDQLATSTDGSFLQGAGLAIFIAMMSVIVILIAILLFCAYRRYSNKHKNEENMKTEVQSGNGDGHAAQVASSSNVMQPPMIPMMPTNTMQLGMFPAGAPNQFAPISPASNSQNDRANLHDMGEGDETEANAKNQNSNDEEDDVNWVNQSYQAKNKGPHAATAGGPLDDEEDDIENAPDEAEENEDDDDDVLLAARHPTSGQNADDGQDYAENQQNAASEGGCDEGDDDDVLLPGDKPTSGADMQMNDDDGLAQDEEAEADDDDDDILLNMNEHATRGGDED